MLQVLLTNCEIIIPTLVKMVRETYSRLLQWGYCNRGETWGSTPNTTDQWGFVANGQNAQGTAGDIKK